jgi:hypothetical protein
VIVLRIPLGKRMFSMIIAAVLITVSMMAGCYNDKGTSSDIKTIAGYVENTQKVAPDMLKIIDWAENGETTTENGTGPAQTPTDYYAKIKEYTAVLEGHLKTVRNYESELAKLTSADKPTLAAAKQYFLWMDNAIESLRSMLTFSQGVLKAQEPLISAASGSFSDELSRLSGNQKAYQEWAKILSTVNCPSFMKHIYARYTKTIGIYDTIFENWQYGLSLGDPLRRYGAYYMFKHLSLVQNNYELMLTKDIQMQFDKVGERLNGTIAALGSELIKASKMSAKELRSYKYTYNQNKYAIDISYNAVNTIYPSLYNTMDSIINFTGISDNGNANILVHVEIPGFTQVYDQMYTLTPQITQFFVHPPLLTGKIDLSSAKDAHIKLTVTNVDASNSLITQKDIPVRIMSKYDFNYVDDNFAIGDETDFLAFLTPEAKAIVGLKRTSIDELSALTSGDLTAFTGYLANGNYSPYENTYFQSYALQKAMSDIGIRYNFSPFSASSNSQRVLYPEDVISTKSGVCIETSLVMASALQSAGMHCLLILPTGHAQVAVETYQDLSTGEGSGEYILIETTSLPLTESNKDSAVRYMTQDAWRDYIEKGEDGKGCIVVDCEYAKLLGITALAN